MPTAPFSPHGGRIFPVGANAVCPFAAWSGPMRLNETKPLAPKRTNIYRVYEARVEIEVGKIATLQIWCGRRNSSAACALSEAAASHGPAYVKPASAGSGARINFVETCCIRFDIFPLASKTSRKRSALARV